MPKGRTAVEVTDKREIAKIAKACKANGGPWSFEDVENDGGFNLRCVRGMTAYRINQKWLELTGKAPKVAAKPKVKAGARQSISTLGLDAILYLIGFRERETLG